MSRDRATWDRVEQGYVEANEAKRPVRPDDPPLSAEEEGMVPYPFCSGAPTKRACIWRGWCAREWACND